MDSSSKQKQCTVVPSKELCCIWMTAGIVSYQLCDREYDCDTCPLDAALRKQFSKHVVSESHTNQSHVPSLTEETCDTLRFSDNHFWIELKHDHIVRVGIEHRLASVLLTPKAIVLPTLGQKLTKGQTCIWIVLEQRIFSLAAPINGEVVSRNLESVDNPQVLFRDPYRSGWLFELNIKASLAHYAHFMIAEDAEGKYRKDSDRLKDLLLQAVPKSTEHVGLTLPDGGLILKNISEVLGASTYFDIVQKVYGSMG